MSCLAHFALVDRRRPYWAFVAVVTGLFLSPVGGRPCAAQSGDRVIVDEAEDEEDDGPIVSDSGIGYIDNAIIGSQFRFRYDAAFRNTQPARAEFFWPAGSPAGPGPGPETSVDYQDFGAYLEWAGSPDWSVFGELPIRVVDPVIQDNTAGFSDANLGFKYALGRTERSATTGQLRVFVPTGDASRGLGNDHVSLEPALLYYRRLDDSTKIYGELRDWISVGGTPGFGGNVLRYGLGVSRQINDLEAARPLSLVAEFVGWTVLEGGTTITTGADTIFADARGDTIVNAKLGARWQLTDVTDLYCGYGVPLTQESWYEDVLRFELRRRF